ncbi:hypothetical protein V6B71_19905 [Mediterraneibacter gnavus]|uniref:sigma-70 family RNA polymerase sigma factor n=1 Tax=Mediterraneibacter gnavus TaxID=33038 RepID=UPI001185A281|nr:sigma-70 family RNA polymerase sigma factor [Mediterraneibacter gnavus]
MRDDEKEKSSSYERILEYSLISTDNEDSDIVTEEYGAALAEEMHGQLEVEIELEDSPIEQEVHEPQERTLLKRELAQMALERLESSARTEDDFRNVVSHWDRLDSNRERRERYHEVGRGDIPLDWEAAPDSILIPHRNNKPIWKQIRKGEFLDAIYHCPFEMHELIEDGEISRIIRELKPEHKELLFYLIIKQLSTVQIGAIRGQSDRNIRKVWKTVEKKIRKSFYKVLSDRTAQDIPITEREQAFWEEFSCLYGES